MSSAAAATNSRPSAPICPQRRRPTPLPPNPLPNQIPIDGQPLTSPPRVLSSEAFGRRPPTRTRHGCTGRRPAGIRNPSRKRTLDDVRQVCPVWLRKRSFEFCSPIGSSMTQAEVLIQQDLQRPSPTIRPPPVARGPAYGPGSGFQWRPGSESCRRQHGAHHGMATFVCIKSTGHFFDGGRVSIWQNLANFYVSLRVTPTQPTTKRELTDGGTGKTNKSLCAN
jgi:hypothetical protein